MSALAVLLVAAWAGAVTWADVRTLRIPRRLRLCGWLCALLAYAGFAGFAGIAPFDPFAGTALLTAAVAGGALVSAVYLVVRLAAPRHLGGGDLRIAPLVGALGGFAGASGIALVLVAPFVVSGVWGLYERATRGRGQVPHGPGMAWSAVAALAWAASGALAEPYGPG